MANPIELASDVVAGATALAGLVLVYLGAVASSFGSYEKQAQGAVRAAHQRRAWFAFLGVFCAIVAAALAVLGKWAENRCVAAASIVFLLVALVWGAITALLTALEVR
jgi:uncharacterized membrane protein